MSACAPGTAVRVAARHHLRAHGVGDHVLQHDADHRHQRGDHVLHLGTRERDPFAGGPRQQDQARCHEPSAEEHVDAPPRAEDRHGIDQLAEHHLHRPRQRHPHANGGEIGRRQRGQLLLDPEAVGDRGHAERAVGEVHHQQRQIGEPERLDGRQHRALQLLLDVGEGAGSRGRIGRAHGPLYSSGRDWRAISKAAGKSTLPDPRPGIDGTTRTAARPDAIVRCKRTLRSKPMLKGRGLRQATCRRRQAGPIPRSRFRNLERTVPKRKKCGIA